MTTIWDKWAAIPGWTQVQGSEGYLKATPRYQKTVHDILWKYGVDPGNQAGMAGISMDFSGDPYSIVNMLKRSWTDNNHSTINAANAAGLEESGAAAGGLNANEQAYNKDYTNALAAMSGELNTAGNDYTDTVDQLFDDAEKNPVTQTPAAAAPSPTGGIDPATGIGQAVPQGPYQRTGAEAGWTASPVANPGPNPFHIPGTNGKALTVAKKLAPKMLTPGFDGRGGL